VPHVSRGVEIPRLDVDDLPPSYLSPTAQKYWKQRTTYFSKFDEGIQLLDEESWFSVTPEAIAAHQARRLQGRRVVDGCCGAGGNAIQLALTSEHVIAVDIDPLKIQMAQANAAVYGVADKMEFILGDNRAVLPTLKDIDNIFLSPPWGGPDYNQLTGVGVLEQMNFRDVLEMASSVTPNVAIMLPRTVNHEDILEVLSDAKLTAWEDDPLQADEIICELESNYLHHKRAPKVKTAYFGDLAHAPNKSTNPPSP